MTDEEFEAIECAGGCGALMFNFLDLPPESRLCDTCSIKERTELQVVWSGETPLISRIHTNELGERSIVVYDMADSLTIMWEHIQRLQETS